MKLMKYWLLTGVALVMFLSAAVSVQASNSNSINEKLGLPIVVYGDALSESQRSDVSDLLETSKHEQLDEFTVTGQDIAEYIGGNPNSNMYSSVKIIHQDSGGLNVDIVSPDNITEVTREMYENALLTAGVENAEVLVASSVAVSGHSALTGIYKAYDAKGASLDKDRMQVASEELDVATSIGEKEGISKDEISSLLTEIKKAIAEQNPATREEVEQIVETQLDSLQIELSPEDRKRLTDLFDQMRNLNINFDEMQSQLDDLASGFQDLINDEGFWNNIKTAVQDFLRSLRNFIDSVLN
ncbi:hypothetical protein AAV35_012035 [Salimicrobium jeotgali]|uniref:DUF1002 domain-containing protein n=2 Tax=Salimicrobium TaxID=351195 RepID=K2G9T5_9BACI|nr:MULTISPECIES: DUF1002 domain-containing protein [Salimicrobium]AKG05422.1 hypothetical protein AAV35_012035 [Salimicrobium jeotgali]EKE31112.1 hypothetical protein MJ3_09792 [Salimicrobium jeotgali]MBM7697273.1 uncharacterized protein YpuA (DUF1002 family) [Salimicrobium jeotgali]SIS85248.1 Uncharacterized protein YpuA, DUF1002 family [Salimicrobium salexigens]